MAFNCSLPHTVAVLDHLDGLSESASVIGTVNCVVRRDGRSAGENSDGQGFLAALRTVVDPAGRSLVLFGAGGAARAIAVEAALAGASAITIVNRNPARGADLVALLSERTPVRAELIVWDGSHSVREGTEIVVNATSVRLAPETEARLDLDLDSPARGDGRRRRDPKPVPRTRLIRDAQARGCAVLDGLGMLVNQALIGIRHWTGADPDAGVMRRTLEGALRALRALQSAEGRRPDHRLGDGRCDRARSPEPASPSRPAPALA